MRKNPLQKGGGSEETEEGPQRSSLSGRNRHGGKKSATEERVKAVTTFEVWGKKDAQQKGGEEGKLAT